MQTISIFYIIILLVFFIIHLSYTQKIYYYTNLNSFFIFALLFPCILIIFNLNQSKENLIKLISFGSIYLVYYLFLLILKKYYNILNAFLIKKKLIKQKFSGKGFTFVYWDGDGSIPDYWDKKTANAPSWLDKLITFLLLILPILSIGLIYVLLHRFFD